MKKIIALLLSALFFAGYSQQKDPVKWMASYKPLTATEGVIIINATIDEGWHTYSQRPTDAGPIPTSFQFEPSAQLIGKTEESDAHEEFVPAFDAKIFVFSKKAEFQQKVKAKKGQQI